MYKKKTPLDAPDKTKPEHFKKSILYVGWQWMINNAYLFFNSPAHNTNSDKLSMQGRVRLGILGALMSITVVLNESVSTFFS